MTTPVLLAIDTAGPRLQLALLRDGAIDSLVEEMPTGQAERLFPAIADLLARNGVAYADLTRVAVTTGPGSFTGVRIGLSAARGLGLALDVPVIGVPTLTAVSLIATGPVAVQLDARRGEIYFQSFSGPGIALDEAALLTASDIQHIVPVDATIISDVAPDISRLAAFAATADPARFPPDAAYVRDADARPQHRFRVARAETLA